MINVKVLILCIALAGAAFAQQKPGAVPDAVRQVRKEIDEMRKAKVPSLSIGTRSSCTLVHASELPSKGVGYRIGNPARKTHFGTDEMIFGLMELGVEMAQKHGDDGTFHVGDISAKDGGKLAPHINHQGGRDVDLGLFLCDANGSPKGNRIFTFDKEGKGEGGLRFDVARNWTFAAAMLESPYFQDLHAILIADWLKALLLQHAREQLASIRNPVERSRQEALIKKAEKKLVQPSSSPHDNHMHLALACTGDDRKEGCRD